MVMTVDLVLFAGLRQLAGFKEARLTLPDGCSVGQFLDGHLPRLAGRTFYVAVNEEYAGRDTVLRDGDVVALLPPVSGGGCAQPALRWPQGRVSNG